MIQREERQVVRGFFVGFTARDLFVLDWEVEFTVKKVCYLVAGLDVERSASEVCKFSNSCVVKNNGLS